MGFTSGTRESGCIRDVAPPQGPEKVAALERWASPQGPVKVAALERWAPPQGPVKVAALERWLQYKVHFVHKVMVIKCMFQDWLHQEGDCITQGTTWTGSTVLEEILLFVSFVSCCRAMKRKCSSPDINKVPHVPITCA